MEDVHAIGTVYNVVEVHVKKETETTKDKLYDLMDKYGFKTPFKIKSVVQQATVMMADIQHENGKLIKSPYPHNAANFREGTLGAFAQNDESRLYALTCGHVVCNPDAEEHDVFIQDRGLRLRKFAKSTRSLTIYTGENPMPLIDIAAVIVEEDLVRHCIRHMKDDCGQNKPASVAEELPFQLLKTFIYKHGAISGLTRGIICSVDFSASGVEENNYLLMIESLPGDVNTRFAKKGDSGAVICAPAVDNDSIKVVGMLSSGDYQLGGQDTQEKYLSFLMKNGLEKLRDRSGISLNVS